HADDDALRVGSRHVLAVNYLLAQTLTGSRGDPQLIAFAAGGDGRDARLARRPVPRRRRTGDDGCDWARARLDARGGRCADRLRLRVCALAVVGPGLGLLR